MEYLEAMILEQVRGFWPAAFDLPGNDARRSSLGGTVPRNPILFGGRSGKWTDRLQCDGSTFTFSRTSPSEPPAIMYSTGDSKEAETPSPQHGLRLTSKIAGRHRPDHSDLCQAAPRRHRYTGLCPFHSEKSPSFSVNGDRQFDHCFGCKAGGDALKFIEQIEHLSFYEALKLLAERNGIPMPKRAEYADADSKLRGAVMTMHEIAEQEFRDLLKSPQGSAARAYVMKRGLAPEMVEHFGLGFSDPSGRWLVRAFDRHSFTQEQLEIRAW